MRPTLLASLFVLAAPFCAPAPLPAETAEERDARMEWFREARFGMFIHWGLYAVPAGEWKGKGVPGVSEWIQSRAQIPVPEYEPLKDVFNPVKYDAEAWVSLAKEAGMKYIVITSKHHDGFCLWDSEHTDWDIASTPYKMDLLKPLAEACKRHGIKLCFYHSIMDWHHPDWGTKKPWRGNAGNPNPDMDAYTAYMKAQLKELLTNYGKVGILWFDGEWEEAWTHERGVDLYDYVRSQQPGIIVNNRVDKGRAGMEGLTKEDKFRGDYGTPEQQIPPRGLPGVDWESCMTMNDSWGYKRSDKNWKSTQMLVRNLIDIASKGGNYLLNVGPTELGEIPPASVERLRQMGAWMKVNGESILGTEANPFRTTPWGRCTRKAIDGGRTRLYIHIFDWPKDGRVVLPGLKSEVAEATFLAKPDGKVAVERDQDGSAVLTVPGKPPDPLATVVAVDIEGEPEIVPVPTRAGEGDVLVLPAEQADLHGQGLKVERMKGEVRIGEWTDPRHQVSFPVAFDKGGPHAADLRWACAKEAAGSKMVIELVDAGGGVAASLPIEVASTGSWDTYANQAVGVLAVPGPGAYTLRLAPGNLVKDKVMNFVRLTFRPAK